MSFCAGAFVLRGGCPIAGCLVGPPWSPVGTLKTERVALAPGGEEGASPGREGGGWRGLPSAGRARISGETLDAAAGSVGPLWAEPVGSSAGGAGAGAGACRAPAPPAALPPARLRGAGAPTGPGHNKFCSKLRQRLWIFKFLVIFSF